MRQTDRQSSIIQRESGIEVLKIIAIFMIVIYHTTQTLNSQSTIYASHIHLLEGWRLQTYKELLFSYLGTWRA